MKNNYRLCLMVILFMAFGMVQAQDPIDDISSKYFEWIVGSSSIDYTDTNVLTRYNKLMNKIGNAESASIPNSVTSKNDRSDLWDNVLFPLAISYHLPGPASDPNPGYQSNSTRIKIIDVFNALNDDGWDSNTDIGWDNLDTYPDTGIIGLGGTYGNVTAGYAVAVFLCKDILIDEGIYNREMATLDNATAATGPAFEEPILWQVGGVNADFVAGLMLSRMAYVLAMESGSSRDVEMAYFQNMLDKALTIADGFADFIKSDYTTNHHKNPYVSTYGSEGLRGASVMAYIVDGSPYAASINSIANLSNAMLAARIYSNLYDYHQGASGRSASYDKFVNLVPAFAHTASINSTFAAELKGAFKRYWAPSHPRFTGMIDDFKPGKGYIDSMGAIELMTEMANDNSIIAEAAPEGHWYFNYAGMSVHRKDEWAAMWKGQGKYLWDFEGPLDKSENIYGKYGSAGALIILNSGSPVQRADSGMPYEGWDWRRVPGTTTLNSSYSAMTTEDDRNFPTNTFIGGINVNSNHGMSSIEYRDALSSLEANKSVFYFENYIVAIGSGITASAENDNVQTTLFQTALSNQTIITYLDGTPMTGIGQTQTINNQAVTATDAVGNAYYIPNAGNFSLERVNQSAPDESGENNYSQDYVSGRLLHGSTPNNETYEYYIDINGGNAGATNLQTNASNLFNVHKSNNDAHIVEYTIKNVTGYALMSANVSTGQLIKETDVPCIAMVKEHAANNIDVTVMNPEVGKLDNPIIYKDIDTGAEWHAKPTIQPVTIKLDGEWFINSGTGATIISSSATETQIQFDCIDGKGIKLNLSSTPNTAPPGADFSANLINVGEGGSVSFIDQSSNSPSSWNWIFAGGSPSNSTAQNPVVTYSTVGTFDVTLTATNANGSDVETKVGYITVTNASSSQTLVAEADNYVSGDSNSANNYGTETTVKIKGGSGKADRRAFFRFDLSGINVANVQSAILKLTPESGAAWNVSDTEVYAVSDDSWSETGLTYDNMPAGGSLLATVQNTAGGVIEEFDITSQVQSELDGSISLMLKGTNTGGSNKYFYTREFATAANHPQLEITMSGGGSNDPPAAEFISDVTSVEEGGVVSFTDQSTNAPTSWSWTFAGGSPANSSDQYPVVTYNTPGTYDVSLTATNADGSGGETKTGYITVTALPTPPVAEFISDVTSIVEGGAVSFTDQSANTPTSWNWTFSGGSPASSSDQNPVVSYSTPGTYDVSLTATNSDGSDGETKTGYITVTTSPTPPVAEFTSDVTSVVEGGTVSFTDQSTNTPTSWSWTFAGGSPSNSSVQNPVVTYNIAGTYDVTLTTTNADGSDIETKVGYITVTSAGGGCITEDFEDFESGWGIWIDGGADARRSSNDAAFANSGSYPIRLRDDSNSSNITTNNVDMSSYSSIEFSFSFITNNFDSNSDAFLLEVSTDGGSSFTQIEEWNLNDEFVNNQRYDELVDISGVAFSSTTQFRIRCDASNNNDQLYIDDINIDGCGAGGARLLSGQVLLADEELPIQNQFLLEVYPNPAYDYVNIQYETDHDDQLYLSIVDLSGKEAYYSEYYVNSGQNLIELDISRLIDGLYIIQIADSKGKKMIRKLTVQ